MPNKYGLTRSDLDAETKRLIRQKSKFGCVICRCGFYEYEHILPEFKDAAEHDPEKMCLLCGRCHNKVTKGQLSKETVVREYSNIQKSPTTKKPWESFDLNSQNIVIKIGSCTFKYAQEIIRFNDKTILAINPPEDNSCFPSVTGLFTNENGEEIFRIDKNEWIGPTEYWDVETIGREIVIRRDKRQIALRIKINPPYELEIITLDIKINNCHLSCKNGSFSLSRIYSNSEYTIEIEHLECYGATIGISINENEFKKPNMTEFTMIGNEGINLVGTGIRIAQGAGKILLSGITIVEANRNFTAKTYICKNDLSVRREILPPRIK